MTLPKMTVTRDGETFPFGPEFDLKPGDVIRNVDNVPARVGNLSRSASFRSQVATLAAGATVRVTDRGSSSDEVLGLEGGEGVSIEEVSDEVASGADFLITPMLTEVSGLFGAAALPLGGLAAGGAAIGLAALLSGSGGDSDGGAGTASGSGASGSFASGLAGGVAALGDGTQGTPFEPATQLTDGLSGALATVGDGIASNGGADPTGVAVLLGETVGRTTDQPATGDTGLVGAVSAISEGLASGGEATPLGDLVTPLSATLGNDGGQTNGVAQGLANVGGVLIADDSALSPLTAGVLGPIVGSSSGQAGGLAGTVDQTGSGAQDLTSSDSALNPLAPVTDGVATATSGVSDGLVQVGSGIDGQSSQDPSGVANLVAEVIGTEGSVSPMSSGAGGADALTSQLPNI